MQRARFAAGTPIRTPDDSKLIEEFKAGDWVLSRDEHDERGNVSSKQVEEVFERFGPIWELRLGSELIRTTAEHPFYRNGEWVGAKTKGTGGQAPLLLKSFPARSTAKNKSAEIKGACPLCFFPP